MGDVIFPRKIQVDLQRIWTCGQGIDGVSDDEQPGGKQNELLLQLESREDQVAGVSPEADSETGMVRNAETAPTRPPPTVR